MKSKKAKKNMPMKTADEGGMPKPGMPKPGMAKPGGKSPPMKKKKVKY